MSEFIIGVFIVMPLQLVASVAAARQTFVHREVTKHSEKRSDAIKKRQEFILRMAQRKPASTFKTAVGGSGTGGGPSNKQASNGDDE